MIVVFHSGFCCFSLGCCILPTIGLVTKQQVTCSGSCLIARLDLLCVAEVYVCVCVYTTLTETKPCLLFLSLVSETISRAMKVGLLLIGSKVMALIEPREHNRSSTLRPPVLLMSFMKMVLNFNRACVVSQWPGTRKM